MKFDPGNNQHQQELAASADRMLAAYMLVSTNKFDENKGQVTTLWAAAHIVDSLGWSLGMSAAVSEMGRAKLISRMQQVFADAVEAGAAQRAKTVEAAQQPEAAP